MADLADLARLLKEALHRILLAHDLLPQDLAGRSVAELEVLGGVDQAAGPFAQQSGDAVIADLAAD